jgi:RHS repeat-associated protein
LFTFTGKQLQPSINLYYLGYRYLDCQSGRFTTPDLQEPNYQNPQSINRYPYALNNPNRYVDPNGRMFIEINDKGERIVGGFEAVTGKGLDQSDTQEPKERSPFGTEMQRQISLLTGNPPSSTSTTMPTSTTSTETTTATTTTTKTKQRNWLLIGVLVADVVAIWILAACLTSAGLGPLAIPLAAMATDIIGGEIANALANP